MGDGYEWFDHKRTLEILDESLVVPEARTKKKAEADPDAPMPSVSGSTEQWYEQLPDKIRPTVLRCKFPHILEEIQRSWESPVQLDRVLNDLMVDDRGGRQGFPFNAIREVHCLRDYYFDVLQPDAKRLLEPKNGLNRNR